MPGSELVIVVKFLDFGSLGRFLQKLGRLRREIVWVLLGQSAAFVGGFAVIKILTNVMGPEEYGQLALGLTIAGVTNLFIYGPIAQWVLRFYSVSRERHEMPAYLGFVRQVVLGGGLLLLLVALPITVFVVSNFDKQWALLAITAVIYGIIGGISSVFAAVFSALRRRPVVAVHQGIEPWLRAVISVFLIILYSNSGYMALIGFSAGALVMCISQGLVLRQDAAILPYRSAHQAERIGVARMAHEFRAFVSPFLLFALFGSFAQFADRWALQGLYGVRDVGIYTVMYQVANAPIVFLFGMINQFAMPIIFEHAGAMTSEYQDRRSRRALQQTVFLSAIAVAAPLSVAYFFGKEVIRIVAAPEFAGQHTALWVLVLGLAIFNVAQLLVTRGLSQKQASIYVWPKGVHAASLMIFLMLFGASGVVGVAVAVLIASFVYLGAVAYANRALRR